MTTAENSRIFDSLEKRIERVIERYRSATEENARLKAKLAESGAELEKAKADIAAARKSAKREEELAAELARHEAENEKVRERLGKLIETLETIDAAKV
jgi:F0F1-type ATP synthase membrane subunit b/b'